MANQKYTAEFRKEAVKMALESDEPKAKIAENLGVNYKTFSNWIRQDMKQETIPSLVYAAILYIFCFASFQSIAH